MNGAVSKTVKGLLVLRGFESHPLRSPAERVKYPVAGSSTTVSFVILVTVIIVVLLASRRLGESA